MSTAAVKSAQTTSQSSGKPILKKSKLRPPQPSAAAPSSSSNASNTSEDDDDDNGGVSLFASSIKKKFAGAAKKPKAPAAVLSSPNSDGSCAGDGAGDATATVSLDSGPGAALTGGLTVPWTQAHPYDPRATFRSLGLSVWQAKVLSAMSIVTPTEIQQRCIPAVLAGHDVVGRAKTGSGKTAAFALPILHTLAADPYGIYALVLTPTRELAFQIADQFNVLGSPLGVDCAVVVGGLEIAAQCAHLERRPHVVIATPGRLAQLVTMGSVRFHAQHLQYLVLDEAERLFEPQFVGPLTEIHALLPPPGQRQTLMFSATITAAMLECNLGFAGNNNKLTSTATSSQNKNKNKKSSQKGGAADADADEADGDDDDDDESASMQRLPPMLHNPVFVQVSTADDAIVATLDQRYLFMPQSVKDVYLAHLLQRMKPDHAAYSPARSVIVFTSTCKGCELVAEVLTQLQIPNAALHSRISQTRRIASLRKFRSGSVRVLVATDVASRGLDIPTVAQVINFDVPRSLEDYIHRTGRTARAGREGQAVTLVTQFDVEIFGQIEDRVGRKMELFPDADEDDVLKLLKDVTDARKIAKIRLEEYDINAKKFGDDAVVIDERQVRKEGKERFLRAGMGKVGAGKKRMLAM